MHLEREVIEGKFDIIGRNLRFLKQMKTISPEQFIGKLGQEDHSFQ
jgi:hypothetical protein